MLVALALPLALSLVAGLDADPEFKKGQQQLDAFQYEKAAATFDKVSKRPDLVPADRAVALVWLGLAYAELRDQPHASVAFEDAVTADPLIVLPRDSSPKIKALLEDARARVRLREKAAPPATPPPDPPGATTTTAGTSSTTPAATTTPGATAPTAPAPTSSPLTPVAIGTTVVGGIVTLAGGAVWAVGLALRQQAIDAPFQSDAATLRDQSVATQIGGQVGLGVGALALAAGGALFAVGALE